MAVRVSALYLAYGDDSRQRMLVQIARSRASREQLARQILVDTALPLSALIALMSVIVWGGIRTGLSPLSRMRMLVEDRAPNDLAPIELDAAPEEVRALAKAINTLLAEVQESVSAQKRFINDAAHQLRTPLAGLKSQTELALNQTDEPELKARLQLVHQSAARSAHLVNQLLALARAEPNATAEQGKTRFDIRKLAAELCAELVPKAIAQGIDLGFGDDNAPVHEPLYVMGHPLLLREALSNLVDNAIRYAGRGKVVTVDVTPEDAQAVVTVEDNGPGLAEADRERVFQRFVRATYDGNGCGLGLAIAREIVARHGGTVVLEPAEPQGVRAVIRLPRA
jgi:two-component system, OmpR family, sensor histidine kinase TctE